MENPTAPNMAFDATLLAEGRPEFLEPDCTLVRPKDVSAITGLARSTISKYIHEDPTFPRPVPLSDGEHRGAPIGFVLAEVQAWVRSRIATRDAREKRNEAR